MLLSRFFLMLLLLLTLSPLTASGETRKIYNLCRVEHPSDADIPWDCRRLKKGETAEKLFGEHWLDLLRFNRIDRRHFVPGVSIKVPRDLDDIEDFTPLPDSYPEAAGEEKFILVDLSEQFLGAYESGELVFSFPIASGNRKNRTPNGDFRVDAFSRRHKSSLYKIEKTKISYPMHYALRFFINESDVAFWLHGRDVPGFPASHGCVGLFDEEMQKKYYRFSPSSQPQDSRSLYELAMIGVTPEPVKNTQLQDSRTLYEWAIDPMEDSGELTRLKNGPRVKVIGRSPL